MRAESSGMTDPSSFPLDPHFHPVAATKDTFFFQELLNTAITTLLYLIAVIVQFCSIGPAPERNIAAGVSQPPLPIPPCYFTLLTKFKVLRAVE